MTRAAVALARVLLASWLGGILWAGVAAGLLFSSLDEVQAGGVASKLFSWVSWTGLAAQVAAFVLAPRLFSRPWLSRAALAACLVIFGFSEGWMRPQMQALREKAHPKAVSSSPWAQEFLRWHRLSEGLWGTQALLAAALVACLGSGCHNEKSSRISGHEE